MEKINQARHIKTFRQKELDEKREREFFEEQKQIRLRQQENLKRIQGLQKILQKNLNIIIKTMKFRICSKARR